MTLRIDYKSHSFPATYGLGSGSLITSWDELLWAAITIGRPNTYQVFRHGRLSFHEAIFRLSLIRMAVEQDASGDLYRTNAFAALDPTEKGMVSYFLGMTLCKLFATRTLSTPWLLHLDVFHSIINPQVLGRSRPDLVGEDSFGNWHSFESKGRSSPPSAIDKAKAKTQAQRLLSVDGKTCTLQVASFAFFRSERLEFDWCDPAPDLLESITLPRPSAEWRFYFEPALSFGSETELGAEAAERELADVSIKIHPEIRRLLEEGLWLRAKDRAQELQDVFEAEGYQMDGIKLTAGQSWMKSYERVLGK